MESRITENGINYVPAGNYHIPEICIKKKIKKSGNMEYYGNGI